MLGIDFSNGSLTYLLQGCQMPAYVLFAAFGRLLLQIQHTACLFIELFSALQWANFAAFELFAAFGGLQL